MSTGQRTMQVSDVPLRRLELRPSFKRTPHQEANCEECIKQTRDNQIVENQRRWVRLRHECLDWNTIGTNDWDVKYTLEDGTLLLHNGTYHLTYRDFQRPSLLIEHEPAAKRMKPDQECCVDDTRLEALRAGLYKVLHPFL